MLIDKFAVVNSLLQERSWIIACVTFYQLSKMRQARLGSVFIFTSYMFYQTFHYMFHFSFHHPFYMLFRFQSASIPLFHLTTSILIFTWLLTYDSLMCFTYI
jgi:hypothetical protein